MKNSRKANLNHHEGKTPYECEHCHEGFDEEENFKRYIESVHEGKKPCECEHCHEGFADEQNLKSHMESDCEKIKIQKLRGESKNQTPDDNTDNENLLEHDEKEEAITNNNKIPQEVQIEVIEGIKLNDIDWNNVEYIYVPEIVEKPIDTDPSSNKLDQAEAIEEPILEVSVHLLCRYQLGKDSVHIKNSKVQVKVHIKISNMQVLR